MTTQPAAIFALTRGEIVSFLTKTETETMGLSNSRRAQEHAAEIVQILIHYRDVISQKANV